LSQAFEPFIEPWALDLVITQKEEHSIQDMKLSSKNFLNINLSYGMAVTIRDLKDRILNKTFKIDEELAKAAEESKDQELSDEESERVVVLDTDSEQSPKKTQLLFL